METNSGAAADMTRSGRTRAELVRDKAVMHAAVSKAMREAVLSHARAGNPVPVLRDDKVVWIPPEEILARHGQGPPIAS